ncbi:MAG: hypothetical protein DRO06_02045 [Thermoproteota archaeon]|nr:MAG: hypothetical protein DRO06_02045 [Candidatus Korarchaeota archaeon]
MERAELIKAIIEELERSEEFRLILAGLLGYRELLERMDRVEERISRILEELRELRERSEEHDRRFNEILAQIREIQRVQAEHSRRFEEHDRRFNEILAQIREIQRVQAEHTRILEEHTKRLEEHDRKFNEIIAEIREIRRIQERQGEDIRSLREMYGSISETLGDIVEDLLIARFREELMEQGLDLTELRRVIVEGHEVDAIFTDEEAVIVEVSTTVKTRDVTRAVSLRDLVERVLRKRARVVILGMKADTKALELARERGVEVRTRIGVPSRL